MATDDLLSGAFNRFFQNSYTDKIDKIAVAVSGGPDSMALAHFISQNFSGDVFIITVDHQLRKEAAREAQEVDSWVQSLNRNNIYHHILRWDGEKPEAAIMEQARLARYDLMVQFCEKENIPLLLTAHHQDDQAETFFIRLIKGSGLDGLTAMDTARYLSKKVCLGRPFLDAPKKALINYCHENNIPFISDPSNTNEKYLRPRLRQLMTGLEEEGLSHEKLAQTSKRLRRAQSALNFYVDQAAQDCVLEQDNSKTVMDYKKWIACPDEIAFRLLQHAIERFRQGELYPVRMNKLEDLFNALCGDPSLYQDRTLGGAIIRLKEKDKKIVIERE